MKDKKLEEEKNIEEQTLLNEEIINQSPPSDEFKDKYVRLLAEFSNYQKQKEEEIKSIIKFGNSNLLLKIIDVLDDIEIGISQENISDETRSILELLKSKVLNLLTLENVEELKIEQGNDVDPINSEVIGVVEDSQNQGKVSQIVKKGYKLGERVLRSAKVMVGK